MAVWTNQRIFNSCRYPTNDELHAQNNAIPHKLWMALAEHFVTTFTGGHTTKSEASRPGADHFQTGDNDVPMRQWDYFWLSMGDVRLLTDVPGCKHLRSAASSSLAISATRGSTIGDRAFVVTAASV